MIEETPMAGDGDRERAQLKRILDGIVDSILEAPEEEIDDDLRALGEDPEKAAMRAKKGNRDAQDSPFGKAKADGM